MAAVQTNQTHTTTERMNECGYRRGRQPQRRPRTIVTYKFLAMIDNHRKQEWEALGWTIRTPNVASHHDAYGVIGEYVSERDEEPPVPATSGRP